MPTQQIEKMIIFSKLPASQYLECFAGKPRKSELGYTTLLRSLRSFHGASTAFEFPQLARQLVYVSGFFRRLRSALYSLYQHCSVALFQETNEQDLHKADYRSDVKQITLAGFRRAPQSTIRGALARIFCSTSDFRNHLTHGQLSIPSILFHCKKWLGLLCLLSPRTVLNFSYRSTSIVLWSFPWAFPRRRGLSIGVIIT